MDPEDVLQLRGLALSLCKTIYTMVVNVKANKRFCQQLGDRVKSLEELVLSISRGRSSSTVHKALKKLCETLDDAQILMMKFFNTSAVKGFFMSSRLKEHFQNMDKRLTDDFHILSGALLIQQGNLLHKVYNTVLGQRQHPARPRIPARLARAHTPIPAYVPPPTPPVSCMGPPMPVYTPVPPLPYDVMMPPMPVQNFMPLVNLPGLLAPPVLPPFMQQCPPWFPNPLWP